MADPKENICGSLEPNTFGGKVVSLISCLAQHSKVLLSLAGASGVLQGCCTCGDCGIARRYCQHQRGPSVMGEGLTAVPKAPVRDGKLLARSQSRHSLRHNANLQWRILLRKLLGENDLSTVLVEITIP